MRTNDIKKHYKSAMCRKAKMRRVNEEKQDLKQMADEVTLKINGAKLERVSESRCFGRILTENNNDMSCIYCKLKATRKQWNCIAKILKQEEQIQMHEQI